jgi:OOP family OmpA-OmpF porin
MKNAALPLLASVAFAASMATFGCGGAAVDVGVKGPKGVDVNVGVGAAPPPGPPVVAVVAPPPAGPRKIVLQGLPLDGAQLAGLPDIEFDTAQATIKNTPTNNAVMGMLLKAGQTYVTITRLRVEGHTDSDGNEADNQRLSEARAQTVVRWLVDHGIDPRRLNPVGCAARDPLVPNDSADHKARNRRTEFDIEEIEGAPVEGATAPCAPNPFRHVR